MLTIEDFKHTFQGAIAIDDDGLQILLDAAEAAIIKRYGESGSPVTETHDAGGSYIFLRHPAVAPVTTVSERFGTTDTELDAADFRLRDDLVSLLRLGTGPNPGSRWGITTVTYTPYDDEAERERIQRALVMLDLNYAPGASSEQIGSWMEQHTGSSVWNYQSEREAILASLESTLPPGFA